jgi:hypothetical protein
MANGYALLTAAVSVVVAVGSVLSAVTALRTSGARKHVERAQGAVMMLESLKGLEQPTGVRLVEPGKESELRDELARIVRENAAAYVKQNPTPVGIDFARVIMPAYSALFLAFSVNAFVDAALRGSNRGILLAGGFFVSLSVVFLGITAVLYSRMLRRNDARRLAGTPGEETYFGPIADTFRLLVSALRKRRAGRAERQSPARSAPPSTGAPDA